LMPPSPWEKTPSSQGRGFHRLAQALREILNLNFIQAKTTGRAL
jgi:hypothetical protein